MSGPIEAGGLAIAETQIVQMVQSMAALGFPSASDGGWPNEQRDALTPIPAIGSRHYEIILFFEALGGLKQGFRLLKTHKHSQAQKVLPKCQKRRGYRHLFFVDNPLNFLWCRRSESNRHEVALAGF